MIIILLKTGSVPWIYFKYLAWQPPERKSDLFVSASDWPKFAGQLSCLLWGISGHLQLKNGFRPRLTYVTTLLRAAGAFNDWPAVGEYFFERESDLLCEGEISFNLALAYIRPVERCALQDPNRVTWPHRGSFFNCSKGDR